VLQAKMKVASLNLAHPVYHLFQKSPLQGDHYQRDWWNCAMTGKS